MAGSARRRCSTRTGASGWWWTTRSSSSPTTSSGVAAVGEDPEELERELGLPEGSLVATLSVYNRHAERGRGPAVRKAARLLEAAHGAALRRDRLHHREGRSMRPSRSAASPPTSTAACSTRRAPRSPGCSARAAPPPASRSAATRAASRSATAPSSAGARVARRPREPARLRRALAATGGAWLWLVLGCASPAGIRSVDAREVHRTLTANVLTSGEPSVPSRQVLQRLGLRELFDDDPQRPSRERSSARPARTDGRVFALAELSFWLGRADRGPRALPGGGGLRLCVPVPGRGGDARRYRPIRATGWPATSTTAASPRASTAEKLAAEGWAGERIPTAARRARRSRFDRSELEWSGWQLGDFLPAAVPRGARPAQPLPAPGHRRAAGREPRRSPSPAQGAGTAARAHPGAPQGAGDGVPAHRRGARAQTRAAARSRRGSSSSPRTTRSTVEVDGEPGAARVRDQLGAGLHPRGAARSGGTSSRASCYGGVVPRLTAAPDDQSCSSSPIGRAASRSCSCTARPRAPLAGPTW